MGVRKLGRGEGNGTGGRTGTKGGEREEGNEGDPSRRKDDEPRPLVAAGPLRQTSPCLTDESKESNLRDNYRHDWDADGLVPACFPEADALKMHRQLLEPVYIYRRVQSRSFVWFLFSFDGPDHAIPFLSPCRRWRRSSWLSPSTTDDAARYPRTLKNESR